MKSHLKSVIPRRSHHRYLYTSIQPIFNPSYHSSILIPSYFDQSQLPSTPTPPTRLVTNPGPTSKHSSQTSNNTGTSLLLPFLPPPLSPLLQPLPNSSSRFSSILLSSTLSPSSPDSAPTATSESSTPTYRFDSGGYGIPKTKRPGKQKNLPTDELPARDSRLGVSIGIGGGMDFMDVPSENENLELSVQVGEDSYFLRPDALGAADGVGGWSHTSHASSANSALFSRRLMHNCSAEIALLHRQATSSSSHASSSSSVNGRTALLSSDLNPIDVLQRAYEKTMQSHTKEGLLGSSTALLAILTSAPPSSSSSSSSSSNPSTEEGTPSQPTLLLKIAHLGDSSLLLLSPSPSTASPSITFSTTPLLHAFNYPYQLGPRSKSSPINDAKGYEVEVKEGDLVVVSSDGMGDNLWEEEVLEEVRMWVGGGGKERETNMEEGIYDPPTSPSPSRRTTKLHLLPRFLSQALAQKARVASEDLSTDVPFGMRARENGIRYSGGKEDDITVLVAVVSRSKLEIRTGS